ncbi:MAG: bifunctional diaminohydroxyphosphoribosylaminopyrimidine deaminase/5-amino-6-(5-phosphoribosylamino)uracil reductase RibD [Alphaproteobacteria bacterium]|nr:bifunctional diaminohydroxyphosphoribosylaminopyrimidine deaminase/5-amino-6-(5-phosphoribosylamino)uracil reductase RibD [Alphaproteobacteria bacterium]
MSLLPEQPQDQYWMAKALRYAALGLGETWPNPSVGCLMLTVGDNENTQFHLTRTAAFGRPHAEEALLSIPSLKAKDSTVYVTLEPCAHEQKNLSCVDRLIRAGVKRVVIASQDPDQRTNGIAVQKLIEAGVSVTVGCLEKQANTMQQGYIYRQRYQRPMVTLKTAISLDGKTADSKGNSQWITNHYSRRRVHLLRAFHDATIVGIGTVIKDNPMLNCRLKRFEHRRSLRIVLDRQLRLPCTSKLAQTSTQFPTWVLYRYDSENRRSQLEKMGVEVHLLPDMSDISVILSYLAGKGLTRVLVEGGAKLHSAFFQAKLVDRLIIFQAPILLGSQGVDMTGPELKADIEQPYRFKLIHTRKLINDFYYEYRQA